MKKLTAAPFLAVILAAASAGAQAAPPQIMNAPRASALPKDIAASLWPERELSPVEIELRSRTIVLRDSLAIADAVVERIERLSTGGSAAAVRSQTRALAGRCESVQREGRRMAEFAATLSTSDARWGDKAVATYRSSLTELDASMLKCRESARRDDASIEDHRRTAEAVRAAIRSHERATTGLFKTLQIPLDPLGARPPVY